MLLSILAEPLRNSEIVSIALCFIVIFCGVLGWFFVRTLKGIDDNQTKLAETLETNFKETFARLRVLEMFKAKIDALHPQNHPNQKLHD